MDQESGNTPQENQEPKPLAVVARLVIQMYEDRSLKVEGTINDKVIAYGLLESARDAIFEKHLSDKQRAIIKSNGGSGILGFVRGMRR